MVTVKHRGQQLPMQVSEALSADLFTLSAFNFVLVLHPINVPVLLPGFRCLLFILFTVEKCKDM